MVPILGQKRIVHHFSNQYPICEKFDLGHTLSNRVGYKKNVFMLQNSDEENQPGRKT
jgi:hypothetical protein